MARYDEDMCCIYNSNAVALHNSRYGNTTEEEDYEETKAKIYNPSDVDND